MTVHVAENNFDGMVIQDVTSIYLAKEASGNQDLVATPGAGNCIALSFFGVHLEAATEVLAKLTEGNGGTELRSYTSDTLGAGAAWGWEPAYRLPANTALVLNLSAAVKVGVNLDYWIETA